MNDIISLCFHMDSDFATHVHTFDNLGLERRVVETEIISDEVEYGYFLEQQRIEIVVAIGNTLDAELIQNHFDKITDKVIVCDKTKTYGENLNSMIRICEGKEIAFIEPNTFLCQHWLTDMLFYKRSLIKSGVVGMLTSLRDYDFLPLVTMEDESVINVFIPKKDVLEDMGVWLVDRQLFYLIGAFTTNKNHVGFEWLHWQKRARLMGYCNYCIPTLPAFKPMIPQVSPPVEFADNVEKDLKEMRKAKNYYIPL